MVFKSANALPVENKEATSRPAMNGSSKLPQVCLDPATAKDLHANRTRIPRGEREDASNVLNQPMVGVVRYRTHCHSLIQRPQMRREQWPA